MLDIKITNRYAKALLQLAIEEKKLETIASDLDSVKRTINLSRELNLVLKSPIIKTLKKKNIFHHLFDAKISDTSLKFCELVIQRQRSDLLESIIDRFFDLKDEYENVKKVDVKTAIELDENQIQQLKSILEQNLNKSVRLNLSIDKSLIGGFIVQIDDTMINASLRYQLEVLRKKFLYGTEKLN